METELEIRDWHWEITQRCNLKCIHCIVGDRKAQELTTKESLLAISRIVQLGGKTLRITGGEPLARKDLGLIIKEAYASGLGLDLITNGTMLREDFLKEYGRFLNHVAVSIDGQKEVHDYIRGKSAYEKTIQSVKKLMNYGVEVTVYITIHALNVNDIGVLVDELISIGVRSFHLNEINSEGKALKNVYLLLEKANAQELMMRLLSQLQSYIEVGDVSSESDCSIAPSSLYLRSSGEIYACSELAFNSPQQGIANILDEKVREKVSSFFAQIACKKAQQCRYVSFSANGISVLLNWANICPFINGVDNGQ